ncbi:MAG: glycosyltransferase [Bdellovibrionales bacterium]
MTLVIDFSHVHRPTTGIERVSLDLFSAEALPGIKTKHVRAKSTLGMVFAQWVVLPLLALFSRKDKFICPGFPASLPLVLLGRNRVIPYIHDLFLIERKQDLNATAKYYMRPSFWFAVHFCTTFFVNSSYTEQRLRKYCRKSAKIYLFRPAVADVFGLSGATPSPKNKDAPLRLVSIGTIEPRKNLRFAAEVREELEKSLGRPVELHLAGRSGWSDDAVWLGQQKGVILHGYCPSQKVREILLSADVFISTSKDEGLGLPLLEVQHGGLFVAASDIPVYREVLGKSGCLLPLTDATRSAQILAEALSNPETGATRRQQALDNVRDWNIAAGKDKDAFLRFFNDKSEAVV